MSSVESTPLPSDALPIPTRRGSSHNRLRRFTERRLPGIILSFLVLCLIAGILYPAVVHTVPAGYTGVLWRRFDRVCRSGSIPVCEAGTVTDPKQLLGEGIHFVLPWDEVYLYDRRLQVIVEPYDSISSDGVELHTTVAVRLRLNWPTAGFVHQFVGPDYIRTMVLPEIGNQVRTVVSTVTAEEAYSTRREEVDTRISLEVESTFSTNNQYSVILGGEERTPFVAVFDTRLLSIQLPKPINDAIDRKTEQFYLVQEYEYRIESERRGAERKGIEASGIKLFQDTISSGITESYLRWRGIDATLQLARSQNAKVVVIGGGKDGLPIILGNVDQPSVALPTDPLPASTGQTLGRAVGAQGGSSIANTLSEPPVSSPPPLSGPPTAQGGTPTR